MKNDKRPDPRPRKNAALWQAYLFWNEAMETRKRHTLRISSAERGKSNLDTQFEKNMMERIGTEANLKITRSTMIDLGKGVGPVWDWLTGIKGLKEGSLAAQLLAQIDYPAPFPGSYPDHCGTISKLWRFAGWGCVDGEIDRPTKGERIHYNKRLKAVCWNIVDQFIKKQTPFYADIYYSEKERQRRLYPKPVCGVCGGDLVRKGQNWKCPTCKDNARLLYTPAHIHNRAIRKTAKIFLSHLWVVWRESEGLPVSEPWIASEPHHTIMPPPGWEK